MLRATTRPFVGSTSECEQLRDAKSNVALQSPSHQLATGGELELLENVNPHRAVQFCDALKAWKQEPPHQFKKRAALSWITPVWITPVQSGVSVYSFVHLPLETIEPKDIAQPVLLHNCAVSLVQPESMKACQTS
mmetsp:Transcript_27227/g.69808  ORF Transcript_27227/g.69808 Transcript_27227/m.69808 type:complete len:135 (+) Transcript_27227:83-487(+)